VARQPIKGNPHQRERFYPEKVAVNSERSQGLVAIRVKAWWQCPSRLGGNARQGLVAMPVKAWWRYASRLGGDTRQGLVAIRVKAWWQCPSRLGGYARQGWLFSPFLPFVSLASFAPLRGK